MPDAAASDASLNLNPKAKDQALAPHEVDLFQRALASPLQSIPKEFETWLVDRIAVLLPLIPIGQIVGFSGFTVQAATTITSSEVTSSGTYGDLSTVGPSLSGLPDGQYVVFFGCAAGAGSSAGALMAVSVNGATPSDDDACQTVLVTNPNSIMRGLPVTLNTDGNNSLVAKYRSASGASTFQKRWLFAIKYANA